MPRNRIRLLETIHVTQKTDRRHHKYASLLVSVLVFPFWGTKEKFFVVVTKRQKCEEFGGLFATKWPGRPAVVYSIFILKALEARSVFGARVGSC